jgi:serine/threonine protein kinase
LKLDGKVIEGKYEFIQQLGTGGMGSVYLVKDLKLGTFWAVKAIEKTKDAKENKNLLAEFDVLKKLDNPALTRITDISEDDENMYIIMDFVDGRSLSNIIKDVGSFSEEDVVNYALQLCDVLIYLHSQVPNPIIHKDIKSGNIMLNKEGRIKLIDFGIAKEANNKWDDSLLLGTAGYVSPEIINDVRNISPQSDIYALGATLFNLLTGIRLDKTSYPLSLLRNINEKFSEGMEYIVAKATHPDLKVRYQNVGELQKDILNIGKIGKEYENKVKIRKRNIGILLGTFIISLLITISGWSGYSKDLKKNFDNYINRGIEARNNMDYNQALKEFEEAQGYLENEKEGYYEIAKTYLVMGSNDECIRYLNNLVGNKPSLSKDEYINYLLGKAYLYKVNYKKSYEYFSKISYESKVDDDFYYLKEISKQFSKPDEINKEKFKVALLEFEKFIEANESDKAYAVVSYLALADIYIYGADVLENAFEKEVEVILKAKKINPGDYGVLDKLASAYREKARNIRFSDKAAYENNLNEALNLYNQCLEIQPSIDTYLNIGDIYLELNKYKEAENAYMEIIEINKDHYLGYLKLSSLNYLMGNKEKAIEYLAKTENSSNLRQNDPQYLYLKKNIE